MSTDFSIRPVGAPALTPVVQPPIEGTVATELPTSQSVTAAAAGAIVRDDPQTPTDSVSHQAFIDQAAAAIVYQVIDTRTQAVVAQYPDEAVLRRRAYFHALDLTKSEPTRILATDRRA